MLWIIRIVGILCILLTAGVLSVGKGAFHEITAAILSSASLPASVLVLYCRL